MGKILFLYTFSDNKDPLIKWKDEKYKINEI